MIERKCFLTMLKIPFHDMEVIGRCHVSISSVHMLKCVIFLLYFFSDMIEKCTIMFFSIGFHIFLQTLGNISFSLTSSVKCCVCAAQVICLPKKLEGGGERMQFSDIYQF